MTAAEFVVESDPRGVVRGNESLIASAFQGKKRRNKPSAAEPI
jgi:hypothetical protein